MDINIFLLKCRVKIYNKTLEASRAKRLNKVLINIRKMFSIVLFHDVETSIYWHAQTVYKVTLCQETVLHMGIYSTMAATSR